MQALSLAEKTTTTTKKQFTSWQLCREMSGLFFSASWEKTRRVRFPNVISALLVTRRPEKGQHTRHGQQPSPTLLRRSIRDSRIPIKIPERSSNLARVSLGAKRRRGDVSCRLRSSHGDLSGVVPALNPGHGSDRSASMTSS